MLEDSQISIGPAGTNILAPTRAQSLQRRHQHNTGEGNEAGSALPRRTPHASLQELQYVQAQSLTLGAAAVQKVDGGTRVLDHVTEDGAGVAMAAVEAVAALRVA